MKLSFSLFFPLAASIRSVLFWFYVILLACFRHFSVFLLISITLSSLDFKTILHNIHNPLWLRKKKLCVWRFECCVCLCKFVLMWAFARFKKKKKKKKPTLYNLHFNIYVITGSLFILIFFSLRFCSRCQHMKSNQTARLISSYLKVTLFFMRRRWETAQFVLVTDRFMLKYYCSLVARIFRSGLTCEIIDPCHFK